MLNPFNQVQFWSGYWKITRYLVSWYSGGSGGGGGGGGGARGPGPPPLFLDQNEAP